LLIIRIKDGSGFRSP